MIVFYCILSSGLRRYYLEVVLRDAALVRSPVGEESSTSVWGRCKSSIVMNLVIYCIVAVNPIQKTNSCQRADHTSPINWLDDLSPLSMDE